MARVRGLAPDGLVVYDIQDEPGPSGGPRPFPFLPTIGPEAYAYAALAELTLPRIVYRCVGAQPREVFSRWLDGVQQAGDRRLSVFVGAPRGGGRGQGLPLGDAYALARAVPQLMVGGIAIAERHVTKGDEDQRNRTPLTPWGRSAPVGASSTGVTRRFFVVARVTFAEGPPNVVRPGSSYPVSEQPRQEHNRMDSARRKAIHDAMVRLSDGDRTAFASLVDELWPVVLAFAQRGVGKGTDAEDVAQEVFYRICARITDFDRTRDGLSWAFGIASFEIKTFRRKRQRRREVYNDSQVASEVDPGASQEDLLLDRELVLAFENAVGALTEDDRRALGLIERAKAPDVMSPTLRKRKQRALDRLKNLWRTIHGES